MKTILLTLIALTLFSTPTYSEDTASSDIEVSVSGMVCDFCAQGLEKHFGKQDAVKSVGVSLEKGLVNIQLKDAQELDDETIKKIVEDNGISVNSIDRNKNK